MVKTYFFRKNNYQCRKYCLPLPWNTRKICLILNMNVLYGLHIFIFVVKSVIQQSHVYRGAGDCGISDSFPRCHVCDAEEGEVEP